MSRYTIYPGVFAYQTCKKEVKTVRLYAEDKELTWMCPEKHLSKAVLQKKKSKKDYE